jgi:hypothetical protein
MFPGVDMNQVEEYYLEIHDQSDDTVLVTTNRFKRACCCGLDVIRVFFVNYLGGIDAVNFKIVNEQTDVKSAQWKKTLPYPLKKFDGGLQRFNVTSNETITAETACFQESDQEWLKELLASPNAWVQWTGTQSQDSDYLPIVIIDDKFETRHEEDRYEYILRIQFIYANDNIILRN